MVSVNTSNSLNTVIWQIIINGIDITIRLLVIIAVSQLLIPHTRINTYGLVFEKEEEKKSVLEILINCRALPIISFRSLNLMKLLTFLLTFKSTLYWINKIKLCNFDAFFIRTHERTFHINSTFFISIWINLTGQNDSYSNRKRYEKSVWFEFRI